MQICGAVSARISCRAQFSEEATADTIRYSRYRAAALLRPGRACRRPIVDSAVTLHLDSKANRTPMPKDEIDPDDPMELFGVGILTDEDTTQAMTECFIEEFLRLGYNHKQ